MTVVLRKHASHERVKKNCGVHFHDLALGVEHCFSATFYFLEREENRTPPSYGRLIREFVDAFKATMIGPLVQIIDFSLSCTSEIQLTHSQDSVLLTGNHSPWVLGSIL